MIQLFKKYENILIKIILFIVLGYIVSKEAILLNEEFLLIISFLIFVTATFNIFSSLISEELNSRSINILSIFREFYFYNITALKNVNLIYKRLSKISPKIVDIYANLMKGTKVTVIIKQLQRNRIRNKIINQMLYKLMLEEIKYVKNIYAISTNEVQNNIFTHQAAIAKFNEDSIKKLNLLKNILKLNILKKS